MVEVSKAPPEKVEAVKKWALIKFREMLRGAKLTEQVQRWLSDELGPEYRFNVEIAMTGETRIFIDDPKNREKLGQERLV